jgi:predicted DNA-binding mobile mystery protein A
LDRSLLVPIAQIKRPQRGWIRSVRQALAVSSGELARRLDVSRALPLQLERSEREDRITLRSLRAVANALDCDLVYAFVPRLTSFEKTAGNRLRMEEESLVNAVQHSMALENQAVDQATLDRAIAREGKNSK